MPRSGGSGLAGQAAAGVVARVRGRASETASSLVVWSETSRWKIAISDHVLKVGKVWLKCELLYAREIYELNSKNIRYCVPKHFHGMNHPC